LGMRRSESVHRRPIVESDRVHDERVAFVMADGFAIPGCLDIRGMLVRQADVANVVEVCQNHHHFPLPLNEIHRLGHGGQQKPSNAFRPATRARRDNELSGQNKLVALAHHISRPGLEDGIVEIGHGLGRLPAGHTKLVIRNIWMREVLLDGAGSARWWDEYAVVRVPCDTWIGRKIGWRAVCRRRKAQAARQVHRTGKSASREVSCMFGHRVPLCDTPRGGGKKSAWFVCTTSLWSRQARPSTKS